MAERQRRSPRQARAGATVDAILEAALQLLEAEGPARFNTNRIAERAGVSIGTLYQYFGGRQDILGALAERRAAAVRDHIAATVIAQPTLGSVRTIVRALMASFQGEPETRRAMMDALIERGGEGALLAHHQAFLAAIEGRAKLSVELTPETAFVLTHAAIGLLRAAAAEPGLGLDPQALEDELVRLMESYISALAERQGRGG
ncbi:TetR/AcrR family transcriptional regulator [Phenylobacterium aquaticum]|uniref:TetR/AcrR family transcriptional regulator n=1 Tax=Phenylobacterium aquaticum TaxID=1763816 RepID=UPI001F5D311A|nr:TetR/AcrR family transcriptional regulator [Phenylobacterium aquaticum]